MANESRLKAVMTTQAIRIIRLRNAGCNF